jgi:predicted hotdog family 3-hydroxylacyl-ACP dehydratase
MLMTRAQLAGLIPHAGAMCLLDGVLAWDAAQVQCVACTHHDEANPLRRQDGLHAITAVEYAAQAMAVHGALLHAAGERPRAGYLAALRDVVCRVARLDTLDHELIITAERLMGDARNVIYRFAVGSATVPLVTGRATVILEVDAQAA